MVCRSDTQQSSVQTQLKSGAFPEQSLTAAAQIATVGEAVEGIVDGLGVGLPEEAPTRLTGLRVVGKCEIIVGFGVGADPSGFNVGEATGFNVGWPTAGFSVIPTAGFKVIPTAGFKVT